MSGAPAGASAPGAPTSRLRRLLPDLIAAGIPLAVLLARTGTTAIDPRSLGWMSHGDSASHLVGWLFFAHEPWHWPPGRIATWLVPEGTSIGFADGIPLLAFPAKLLAGPVAAPFQYFGLWVAACLVLHGLFGRRLLLELGADERASALGGALLALSPIAWERFGRGHQSLVAQWLVVAALLLWLRLARRHGGGREPWYFALLAVVAALVHPYLLLLVVVPFAGAVTLSAAGNWRRIAAGLLALAVAGLLALAALWSAGFLGSGGERLEAGYWGPWSADLGALIHPHEGSRYVSGLPELPEQSEGFGYLGAGVLGIGLAAAGARLVRRARGTGGAIPGYRSLWIVTVVLALIAALPRLRLLGLELVDLSRLSAPVESVLGIFRANGRLLWPLHAWAAACLIAALGRSRLGPRSLTALLALALVVQVAEPRSKRRGGPVMDPAESRRLAAEWRGRSSLEMLPPYLRDGYQVLCGDQHDDDAWVAPALLAAQAGLTFDSGYVARLDPGARTRQCERAQARLASADLEPGVLYLARRRPARALGRAGASCRRFDRSLWLCMAGEGSGSPG